MIMVEEQDVRLYYRALRYGEHKGEGNDDDGGGNVDDHEDEKRKMKPTSPSSPIFS